MRRKQSAQRIPDVDPKSPAGGLCSRGGLAALGCLARAAGCACCFVCSGAMPAHGLSVCCFRDPAPGPAGVALTDAVQGKLRQFLGADYVDRSLAQASWVHKAPGLAAGQGPVGGCWARGWTPQPHQALLPRAAAAAVTAFSIASPPLLRFAVCCGHAGSQDGAAPGAGGGATCLRRAHAAISCCRSAQPLLPAVHPGSVLARKGLASLPSRFAHLCMPALLTCTCLRLSSLRPWQAGG